MAWNYLTMVQKYEPRKTIVFNNNVLANVMANKMGKKIIEDFKLKSDEK